MKKVLTCILSAAIVATGAFSLLASAADGPVYEDSTEYKAYLDSVPQWKSVYMSDSTDYSLENLKDMTDPTKEADYKSKIPGADGGNIYGQLYIMSGDPNARSASTADTMDVGLKFTAPAAGAYRLDAQFAMPAYDGTDNADGAILTVYDKELTELTSVTVNSTETFKIDETVELAANESVYLFINKNKTNYSDGVNFSVLSVFLQKDTSTPAPTDPLKDATFPKVDVEGIPATNTSIFQQHFNVEEKAGDVFLWRPFFVKSDNTIGDMVRDPAGQLRYVLPADAQTEGSGDNWTTIWENVGNAITVGDTKTIGLYFTAPADGKININSVYTYASDPATSDGVGVTVYKNKIASDSVLIERTLFDAANAKDGKALSKEGIEVKKGDIIIYVYDKNEAQANDNLGIAKQQIEYTEVKTEPAIIKPTGDKIKLENGKLLVAKDVTIEELEASLGLAEGMVPGVYNDEGEQPRKTVPVIGNAVELRVFMGIEYQLLGRYEIAELTTQSGGNEGGGNEGGNEGGNQGGNGGTGEGEGGGSPETSAEGVSLVLILSLMGVSLFAVKKFARR